MNSPTGATWPSTPPGCVLDASAVIALLRDEPGADRVWPAVQTGAVISAVNLAEVISKMLDKGTSKELVASSMAVLDLEVIGLDAEAALQTAWLRPMTRTAGLSLGDRACLALARARQVPVLTADRPWLALAEVLALDIRCIRPDAH